MLIITGGKKMADEKKTTRKEAHLSIDSDKFAKAMDRLATDKAFQEKLDKTPLDALKDLGIEIDAETKEAFKGKSFEDITKVEETKDLKVQPVATLQVRPKITGILTKSKVISLAGKVLIETHGDPRTLVVTGPGTLKTAVVTGPGALTGPGMMKDVAEKKKKETDTK
jgi:hypothetical protein